MRLGFLDSKDFWAGAVLIATGALALFIARDYSFGTMVRMGPGYLPSALGGLLVLFGLYLAVKGLRKHEGVRPLASNGSVERQAGREGSDPFVRSLRALIVLPLSLALFGFLMDRAGLVPALAVLIVGSAAAGREFRLVEAVLLAILLITFSVAVFVWGLGLPYRLIVGH